MASDFYVEPASPLPGLQAFTKGYTNRMEYEREKAEKRRVQEKMDEGAKLLETGTPEQVRSWAMKNPGFAKYMDEAIDIDTKLQVNMAKDILAEGSFPAQSFMEEAKRKIDAGQDATLELSAAKRAQEDPEFIRNEALKTLALYDETAYETFMKQQAGGEIEDKPKQQKTGAFLVRNPEGGTEIAVGSFDPATGTLKTETASLSGYDVISKLGETAGEQTERRIEETQQKAQVSGEERRAQSLIERGVNAAESTAVVRRGLELLERIKTGGANAAKYQAKRIFGVESGDEGELSNLLGKAVLSQLRETFGAAFTENEGKRLERIEASFGKSVESNKRLLNQVLRIAEKTANRARKEALSRGDQATVDDIDDLLTFSLGTEAEEPKDEKPAGEMSTEELKKRAFEPGGS